MTIDIKKLAKESNLVNEKLEPLTPFTGSKSKNKGISNGLQSDWILKYS